MRRLLQDVSLAVDRAQDRAVRAPRLDASVGSYQFIAGYKVVPAPVEAPSEWREIMRMKRCKWVGKHPAHNFEDGWADAPFRGAAKDGQKIFAKVSLDDDL